MNIPDGYTLEEWTYIGLSDDGKSHHYVTKLHSGVSVFKKPITGQTSTRSRRDKTGSRPWCCVNRLASFA